MFSLKVVAKLIHKDYFCTKFFNKFYLPEITLQILGPAFGDPHFLTLDGKNYTFNGCGWYTYFKGEIAGNKQMPQKFVPLIINNSLHQNSLK